MGPEAEHRDVSRSCDVLVLKLVLMMRVLKPAMQLELAQEEERDEKAMPVLCLLCLLCPSRGVVVGLLLGQTSGESSSGGQDKLS